MLKIDNCFRSKLIRLEYIIFFYFINKLQPITLVIVFKKKIIYTIFGSQKY